MNSGQWFFVFGSKTHPTPYSLHMATRKSTKRNVTKIRGQHRCKYCGKDLPTATGLNHHISNSRSSGCREKREQEALRREARSPNPPATGNDAVSPRYDLLMLDFPLEEPPAYPRPESPHRPASPDQSTPEPPSKRVRVEEVDDEEVGSCHRWAQEFDGAAAELGEGKTMFEELRERQEAMCEPPMAPFADEDEWDLARWLVKNVTQTATEEFLKMKGVRHD
jgi:hypothetical protein